MKKSLAIANFVVRMWRTIMVRHLTMAATENRTFFAAENSLLFFQNVPLRDSPIAVKMLDVSRFEGKVCPRN